MFNILFLVLCVLFAIVYKYVGVWSIIKLLGFNSQTPVKFIQHEIFYHLVSWLLLIMTIIISFFTTWFPWWVAIIIILIIFLISRAIARKSAVKKFRIILKSISDDYFISSYLEKSDKEILMIASNNRKRGIG